MTRKIAIIFILTLNLAAGDGLAAEEQGSNTSTGEIVVTVTGLREDEGGDLIVSLYDSNKAWLDIENARVTEFAKVDSDSMVVRIPDVPYGTSYALAVIHDKNRNSKLDMRRFPWPKPKEGAGVSNNKFGFGPPDYEDALIELNTFELAVRIEMRY